MMKKTKTLELEWDQKREEAFNTVYYLTLFYFILVLTYLLRYILMHVLLDRVLFHTKREIEMTMLLLAVD